MPGTKKLKFDELILSKTRLGIISALISGDKLEFTYLRDTLNISDGNLSVQIRKLEDAGYIKVKKVFVDRKPKTFCKITPKGQKSVQMLINKLENLVDTSS
jgi:DNA-binding MarR family transcriptional regulator